MNPHPTAAPRLSRTVSMQSASLSEQVLVPLGAAVDQNVDHLGGPTVRADYRGPPRLRPQGVAVDGRVGAMTLPHSLVHFLWKGGHSFGRRHCVGAT